MQDDELDDDLPVGRLLSRKELLGLLGGAGIALIIGGCGGSGTTTVTTASPSPTASSSPTSDTPSVDCVAAPEMTEGPYWVDEMLNRSDIRSDPTTGTVKQGTPLVLTLYVASVGDSCAALAGAMVDIWHCDAGGVYSDVSAQATTGQKFLRGYQVTDANGKVEFTTIYPGWYSGRAVHIHFRVRSTTGQSWNFTSQFFFNDTLTDTIYTQAPYNTRGTRDTRNTGDNIYSGGGSQMILPAAASGSGYAATFTIGLTV